MVSSQEPASALFFRLRLTDSQLQLGLHQPMEAVVSPDRMPDDVMIVEDDPNTRFLLQVAAEQSGLYGPITVAPDGRAALEPF